jgi:hypothetical protein
MDKRMIATYLFCGFSIFFVFLNFFISPLSLGGDFNFISYDHFRFTNQSPQIWDSTLGNGLGEYALFTLPFFYYGFFANKLTWFVNNPFILHKLIFLIPLLITGFLSILSLSKYLLKNKFARVFAIILYLINPYFMMLTSGGQIGVAFAYAFSPFVIKIFIQTLEKIKSQKNIFDRQQIVNYISSSLALSLLISFDTRLALLIILMIILVFTSELIVSKEKKRLVKSYTIFSALALFTIFSWHAYWILPSLFVHSVELPRGYASIESVEFFSFARLAHAISWSHPNYPDNIFGKVNEIKGIELIFPILAFSALFIRRKLTLYLGVISALSIFLIKGTNPPFGSIYNFIFQYLPGGALFRDSTKFFLPLSLSYSILIGLSIEWLIKIIPEKFKTLNLKSNKLINFSLATVLIAMILAAWWPTFSGQLQGTLAYRTFPQNYNSLRDVIQSDNDFGRVLWIPDREMYGYSSLNHPAVSLNQLRQQPTCIDILCLPVKNSVTPTDSERTYSLTDLQSEISEKLQFLNSPDAPELLNQLGIKYIVIPEDHDKSIFQYDRKYNQGVKDQFSLAISNISYAQKLFQDSGLELYKLNQNTGVFKVTIGNEIQVAQYQSISPSEYLVTIPDNTSSLIFAQSYNSNWSVIDNGQIIYSAPHQLFGNTFAINPSSSRQVKVKFQGQQVADVGWLYSNLVLFTLVSFIIFFKLKSKNR